MINEGSLTYDMSSQLDPSSTSRRGLQLMSKHFAIGEINPVTVLLLLPEPIPHEELQNHIAKLSDQLYSRPGVKRVRTADDPLGDFPPDRDMSLSSSDAWLRRALKNHRISQRYYYSNIPCTQKSTCKIRCDDRRRPVFSRIGSTCFKPRNVSSPANQSDRVSVAWCGSVDGGDNAVDY